MLLCVVVEKSGLTFGVPLEALAKAWHFLSLTPSQPLDFSILNYSINIKLVKEVIR
jgi:hypothetical protein